MRSKKTQVNSQIRAKSVRLIDQEGNQVGVISSAEALQQAMAAGLDLVEVSPNADPPVCRIMDYGRYLFSLSQKKKASKKKQRRMQVKEVKFRPVTDIGDFQIKLRKIGEFLNRGDKVKVSLRFRGREMQHPELALDLFQRVKDALPAGYQIDQEPKVEGRQMTMLVSMGRTQKAAPDPDSETENT